MPGWLYISRMQDDFLFLAIKNLRREDTPAERAALLRCLEKSEENRRIFAEMAASFSLHETLASPALPYDTDRMLSRLNARIEASAPAVSGAKRVPWGRIWAIACSVAAVLLLGVWVFPRLKVSSPVPFETLSNVEGDIRPVVLEDGTHVYLRPGAIIKYNVQTLKTRRMAYLSGEAYFDVARNEDKPFIVKTSSIGVQVLGTAFAVSASEESAQVILERGAVRLLSPENAPMVSLVPNQKATFKVSTGDVRVEPVYAAAFVTSQYNLVSIPEATVPEIMEALQERFQTALQWDDEKDGRRYNLAFLKSDSLEDVISMVEYMTGIQCKIIKSNQP